MLSFFRRGITAKLMLVVLGIGLFAIVITGFGTGGGGLGGTGGPGAGTIAKVGGDEITGADVTQEFNRQLARARQTNPELDIGTFLQTGALEQIVDQMIGVAATAEYARSQGLSVSRAMIDQEIASIPAFQNLAGQFDQQAFLAALQREKITEADLRREIETRMLQRQLLLPAAGSAFVPRDIASRYASLLLESRSGTVGVVPTAAMGAGKDPTDAEVAAYYRNSQVRYTVPERRVIRYATFGPEQVGAAARATDAEIEQAYRQNPAYAAKETRTLSQVVLPDEAAARALAQRVAGGASFAQAAQQAGFGAADIALGELSKEAYQRASSPAVANAVFGAATGALAGPVRGPIGWHVVKVENVKTTPARPLASVRAEVAQGIEQRKRQEAVADLASRIEAAVSEGLNFNEVAQREKLTIVETPPVTAQGAAPSNPAFQPAPELAPLLTAAFEVEANAEPVVETIAPNERYALVTVSAVEPAAAPPLAQIRDRVKADLSARNAGERARAVATSIMSKINAGTPPAQAFAEAQIKLPAVQSVSAVRRDIARQGQQVPPALQLLFTMPRGKAKVLPAPNGSGWFVVYLDKVVPGDAAGTPELIEAVKTQFAQVIGDEYAQQFTAAARIRGKVKRNEEALAKLKQELQGGGPAQ
ncbi:MAG TPA: SurA N-terminal domain-containing protein [Allosphingosinicella sp.]|nr:SurA N-terminal domain-containing protein [Allosphingosinicella sp.]